MGMTFHARFDASTMAAVGELAERARRADAAAPFSDGLWQAATSGHTTLAITTTETTTDPAGRVIGAAFAAQQGERLAAELVVDPAHRHQGHGRRLLGELLGRTSDELWAWAHGDHPDAAALARRFGLERARELLQLRRAVGSGAQPLPDVPVPEGVHLRTFVAGQDEDAWLRVNNAAFAWHPEQGGQTLDDIRAAEAAPDFDPAGFFLAVDGTGRLLGFHWTKVHPHDPNAAEGSDGAPIGEVYVLGVDPGEHGRGLGGVLTIAGLRHLADVAGVGQVMLYVEGDNTAALKVYERLGFSRHVTDVAYRR